MDYLYGAYGAGNFGDDLICQGALQKYPNVSVIFAFFVKPSLDGFDSSKIILTQNNCNNVIEHLKLGSDIKNRRFIIAGGGLCWSSRHITEMLTIAQFCKQNEISLIIDRIGLQGMNNNIPDALQLLTHASSITVRDQSSKDTAYKFGFSQDVKIDVQPCFVRYLPELKYNINSINCFLSLYLFLKKHPEDTIELCRKIVSTFPQLTFKYLIQTAHYNENCSEIPVVKNLAQEVPEISILNYKTPMEYYYAYNHCKCVISTGYHASLIPSLNGIPVFHLAYQTHVESKYLAVKKENNLDGHIQGLKSPLDKATIINGLKKFFTKNHIC